MNKPLPLIVIAPNGLKLREGPGTQYKALEIAPYKSIAFLIDRNFIQYDPTQKIKLPGFNNNEDDNMLRGGWLKIKYKNKNGYMLSTWLYPSCEYSESDLSGINRKIQIFDQENHFDCFNIPNPATDYWYDLSTDSKGQFSMEKTQIEFLVSAGDIGYGVVFGLMSRRVDNKKAKRFIRSVKPLAEGKLLQLPVPSFDKLYKKAQEEAHNYKGDDKLWTKNILKAKNEELKKVHILMSHDYEKHETKIFSTIKGEKKLMYIKEHSDGIGIANVSMVADLDGDGILDYILGFGDEKSSVAILFLSSEAAPGFSHKAVAAIADGYIC